MRYPRVREAYRSKEKIVKQRFSVRNIAYPPKQLFIRILKSTSQLEVWAKSVDSLSFQLVHSYDICSFSGDVGPKRAQGDLQLPEGFYTIDRFNPVSNFYLSLGINYPNRSDKALTSAAKPGGDIFIHGDCVSIGCAAMRDSSIKEIYVMAVEARNYSKSISVHIFPTKLSGSGYSALIEQYPQHQTFWESMQFGYNYFEKNKELPEVCISQAGWYINCTK
ncbi:MAG: L,D-transpeptidase family protein [Calditrichia bacterium]